MADHITLKIFDIVGGPVWVSSDDGQKVFDKIVAAFRADRAVDLSFANRENMITAFLNAAIGQLYGGQYDEVFLKEHLTFRDISDDDRAMLERAIANARRYFANRAAYDQAWREVTDADEE
ncbi:STAS-like domain-containing protein [Aromatoleum toluclasticum]|uniref:STAS-like domain-containing protein n=1 Tax=Aromatoleum toluclasticum TaxID=92003 RepID=UPI0003611BF3|nr:STAS-like domain-containing protein [Aromatoleum toluclasticum]